jgi:hypothetical protein
MTEKPNQITRADIARMSSNEDFAKVTLGDVVIALARRGEAVSMDAIRSELEARAGKNDPVAEGALRVIASLPLA